MKIKSYRAATLREALEQVKQELGEDALVLDTKRVRAGGFLGVGARELVEVRVAGEKGSSSVGEKGSSSLADAAAPAGKRDEKQGAKDRSELVGLRLTDSAPATKGMEPFSPTELEPFSPPEAAANRAGTPLSARSRAARGAAFAALTARAYSGAPGRRQAETPQRETKEIEHFSPPEAATAADGETERQRDRETERSSPHLPVSPSLPLSLSPSLLESGVPLAAAQAAASGTAALPTQRPALSLELERLRAELREVKFSLNALAVRPVARESHPPDALSTLEHEPEVYDSPYYETYLELTAAGLPPALARQAVRAAISSGMRDLRDTSKVARVGLVSTLSSVVRFADDPLAAAPGAPQTKEMGHFSPLAAIVFIGPTGVGKTTTIAKLAARIALRARRRVELVTLDTYRIAAVEQLKTYAEIIGAGCHVARSVVELDALTRRYAGEAAVLIDTVGRSPQDLADQMELADYLRESPDLLKCLVMQATTHPTDAALAIRKFALYGADRLVITKLDETARPGAAVSVAADAALPLVYLCAGQRVPEDLERATPLAFAARVVRVRSLTAAA